MNDQKSKIVAALNSTLSTLRMEEGLMLKILELLTKELGGCWSTYWEIDNEASALKGNLSWHPPEINATTLNDDAKFRKFSMGEGMPGKVWKSKSAEWSRNVINDMILPRSLKAINLGLEAGMWIPVFDKNNIYGVIEILGNRSDMLTNGIAHFLQSLGEDIGNQIANAN